MKNIILLFTTLSIFISCQNKPATTAVEENPVTDTVPKVEAEKPAATQKIVADASPRPYFRGSGNEPGWILTLQSSPDGSFPVVLVHNYGADTLSGTFNKLPAPQGGKPLPAHAESFAGNLQLRGKAISVEALLTKGKCADDMSGKEASASVVIQLERRTHRGCGKYSEGQ